MELNLTIPHLLGFCVMAYMASSVVTGTKLYRLIAWIGLWQLATPVRPIWYDVPMMMVSFVAVEWAYLLALKTMGGRSA